MDCKSYEFTRHAVQKMFERDISIDIVKHVVKKGEVIQSYPYDKPYPSFLILCQINKRPIHTVLAKDEVSKKCIIITAYEPSTELWSNGFRTKK